MDLTDGTRLPRSHTAVQGFPADCSHDPRGLHLGREASDRVYRVDAQDQTRRAIADRASAGSPAVLNHVFHTRHMISSLIRIASKSRQLVLIPPGGSEEATILRTVCRRYWTGASTRPLCSGEAKLLRWRRVDLLGSPSPCAKRRQHSVHQGARIASVDHWVVEPRILLHRERVALS